MSGDLIGRILAMEACAANEESETLMNAAEAIDALAEAVRFADTRAVSKAAYPHACVEERKLRDLIDKALRVLGE